jgi:pimeloyl-ACP methyl ester carboxylesterase
MYCREFSAMRNLMTLALTIVGALVVWAACVWLVQRSVLFPVPPAAYAAPNACARAGGETQWLELPFGRVEVCWLPATVANAETTPQPVLLYAHGNGELIDYWPHKFDALRAAGLHVLLVEYPGYGRSAGAPSAASIRATLLAAYDHAVANPRVDSKRIVAMGRSLGGGAVTQLARERDLAALILESSFTSVADVARRLAVPAFLIRDRFESAAVLRNFDKPVLVVHGRQDTTIPVAHGRQLAAISGAELHVFDCGHNDCPSHWELVRDFLQRNRVL